MGADVLGTPAVPATRAVLSLAPALLLLASFVALLLKAAVVPSAGAALLLLLLLLLPAFAVGAALSNRCLAWARGIGAEGTARWEAKEMWASAGA